MITFYGMGQSGNINASDIMTGLSLALKATALGLTVTIPTLIFYNGLQRASMHRHPLGLNKRHDHD